MTALEYMEKQVQKHRMNLEKESARGAPEEMIRNIRLKVGYYEEAVEMLNGEKCENCKHYLNGTEW